MLSSYAAASVRPRSVRLATMTTLATVALLLTGCGGDAVTPAPGSTANRREIVFAYGTGGDLANEPMELFQITTDGRLTQSLLGAPGPDYYPEWSRDGSHILFDRVTGSPAAQTTAIWIANADGTGVRKLAVDTISQPNLVPYQVHAAWSPDGASIVFHRYLPGFGGGLGLAIINADGTGLRWLGQGGDTPSWSIDGRIAFGNGSLYTISPDGSGLQKIPSSVDGDFMPKWSRDGTRLLFTHRRADGDGTLSDVMTSRADGSDRRILVTGGTNLGAAWSPDGQYILFERGEPGYGPAPKCSLHRIPSTGGADVNLTPGRGVGSCAGASWRAF